MSGNQSSCGNGGIVNTPCNYNPGLILADNIIPQYVSYGDPVYLFVKDTSGIYPMCTYKTAPESQNYIMFSNQTFYESGSMQPTVWTIVQTNNQVNLDSIIPCGKLLVQNNYQFYLFSYWGDRLILQNADKTNAGAWEVGAISSDDISGGLLEIDLVDPQSGGQNEIFIPYGQAGIFNIYDPNNESWWINFLYNKSYYSAGYTTTKSQASEYFFMYAGDPSIIEFLCCIGKGDYGNNFCGEFAPGTESLTSPGICQQVLTNYCARANQADINCGCQLPANYYKHLGLVTGDDELCAYEPCTNNPNGYITTTQRTAQDDCDITVCGIFLKGISTPNVNTLQIQNECNQGNAGQPSNNGNGSGKPDKNFFSKWKNLTKKEKNAYIGFFSVIGIIFFVIIIIVIIIIFLLSRR